MKKLFLFLFMYFLSGILFGHNTFKNNLVMQKVSPVIYLNVTGDLIDFYNSDFALVLTSNELTGEEGDLKVATPGNATSTQCSSLVTNVNYSGDATGSADLTLATVTATPGNNLFAPTITVNAKGPVLSEVATDPIDFGDILEGSNYLVAANDATAEEKSIANAFCDGISDQVQINAALTAGNNIKLSSGTFNISATITAAVNNVIIEGTGKEKTTIFLSNSSNCHVITIGGNFWTIKNLLINGNHASNTTLGNGIFGIGRTDININNCELENTALNGIAIKNNSNNWVIESCYIHDVGSACIFGYQESPATDSPSNIKISDCHMHNSILESQIKTQPDVNYRYLAHDWDIDACLFTGTTGYKGVLFSGSKNCNISNCYFNIDTVLVGTGYAAAVRYYRGASGIISGNSFVSSKSIEIWGGVDINVINNYFTGLNQDEQDCIRLEAFSDGWDVSNINIEGNLFYNISRTVKKPALILYAMGTQTVSKVNIVGNTFKDDRGASALCHYGIVVNGTGTIKNVNISDNKMEGILEKGIVIVATTTEDFKISNNIFKDVPIGINATDWSNLNINGNRFTNCPYPMNK